MNTTPEQIADLTKAHTSAHQDLLNFISSVQTRMNQLETELQQTKSDLQSQFLVAAPVGSIIVHAAQTPPNGWFECDGAQKSRTDFVTLFNSIGINYGEGDGSTTFNLPDLRGEFVRGWDHERGVDGGRVLGGYQKGTLNIIDPSKSSVNLSNPIHGNDITNETNFDVGADEVNLNEYSNMLKAYVGANLLGLEAGGWAGGIGSTRPRNLALMYCIKY